jgi:hypothetical protein
MAKDVESGVRMEEVAAADDRVRRLMAEFGYTEAEALQIVAETGEGDVEADPPLTEEQRRDLGLAGGPITEDPRCAYLKDRPAVGVRKS